jgi:hypothetical protein
MFRFRPEITQEHKDNFQRELKKLKNLSCVKDNNLLVGGPSVTEPRSRSQGYHYCLVSYHQNLKALEEYQASQEHHEYVPFSIHNSINSNQDSIRSTIRRQADPTGAILV